MSRILHTRALLAIATAVLACAISIPVLAAAQGGGAGAHSSAAQNGRNSRAKFVGRRGPRGFRGTPGSRGAEGPTGTNGANGANGAPGSAGATGSTGMAGATGSQGPKGETGSTGPPPTTLWAVVDEGGNLVRHGTATSSAAQLTTGVYEVAFERNISQCAFTATLGSTSDGEAPAGEIAVSIREVLKIEQPKVVAVHTYNPSGTPTPEPFHLVVSC